ncbi:hypothetical protein B296_00033552 [Ensete ventricosum]|uniref:Uncharacterized protein n=1 Tax=Ensete ventricosum TaxID=4639 RepID=A0A427AAK0_ENSVE|nr:hypothetical protein B296_00033552 [Ensete ventricosum]
MTRVRSRASTTRSGRKRRDEESKPGVGGVLIELALGGEDDEGDLRVAEDGDLVGLLEQPRPALGEGHLPIDLVLDPLQLHPPPPHLDPSPPLPSSNSNLGRSGDVDGYIMNIAEKEKHGSPSLFSSLWRLASLGGRVSAPAAYLLNCQCMALVLPQASPLSSLGRPSVAGHATSGEDGD